MDSVRTSTFLIFSLTTEEVIIVVLLGLFLALTLFFLLKDFFQKKHTILRNYPVIGHFRYYFEKLGVYFRQYFYEGDREGLPFNRAQRSWVYQAAKNVETVVSFGSTRDISKVGTIYFVDDPFPVLGRDATKVKAVTIGPYCDHPYTSQAIINISAMSYGALSKQAILALGRGAKKAGCWLNTGEGGISPYHLESGCDLIAQIGTAKYGYRDADGNLSDEKLKEAAAHPQVKMFEIKLSQGAKPGKGGMLPAIKVTDEIAKIRGIEPHTDSESPNRHIDIANSRELLDVVSHVREVTGKPTGFKTVLGSYEWLDELFTEIIKRGLEHAPDFITLDGAHGGTGAAPLALMDYMGLPLQESLPVLVDKLIEYGLRDRIKVIASGKLIDASAVAAALCTGADFINSARGFLFSLGCIQAMRCHTNRCPTGITTHNKHYTRGLVVADKAERVYHYATNLQYEVAVISHSCGVKEPRELTRRHARVVTGSGVSKSFEEIHPTAVAGCKLNTINKE